MRRVLFFIAIFLFTLSSVMGQKIPINLPADGNWPTIVGDSIMIIGPLQNELTEEQRYFNPVYLMVYPGKEHLKAQMIRAGACDCDPTIPNRRIGVFSVAPDKQVSFSQGNLQYLPAINLWKFANTQYEYLGNANKYLKPTFRNWVDLFGWSANNTTAPFGVSTSMSASDYAGDFVDWGTNTICGDMPGIWRTLSVDEWGYLFQGRKNATQLYSKGNIDGLRGMIILPDNWVMPEGLHFTAQPTNLTMELDINTYTQAEWQRMEEAGAVFLCPTGRRDGTKIDYLEYYGGYWSSSKISNSNHVCHMYYNYKSKIFMTDYKEGDYSYGTNGRAVRLVHDTIVPETIPEPCFIVKVNDTLSINMMCVEGGTFQMGATPEMDPDALAHEAPVHSVTLSDYYIGQIEVTQALWKTVMGTNPSTIKDNNRPVNNVSWEDCQVFIEKLNQKTGYSFRLPTEAEWEYAARGGNKSRGYKYAGSDNIDEVAWYKDNSGGKYQPSALKKPNELGIYDMSGNVFEWCQDWYGPYSADAQVNPQGPESGPYHMIRGGGWKHIQSNRVTYRRTTGANLDITSIGLRLVLDDTALTPPEPEYVDLGLSVKWATFNVGATSPNEIGNFYAWGEIEPKDTYTLNNYKWWNKTSKEITKYCTIDSLAYGGVADGLTELQPQDDIAHTLKGKQWRMPDLDECKELVNGCTWTVSTRQGQIGFEGTSKINGNTIFLPVAGFRAGANLVYETLGGYWSSTLNIEKQSCAMGLYLNQETPAVGIYYNSNRQNGFLIRPVYDDRPPKRIGVFSVAADKQVSFSQGNLQYTQSKNQWCFAENQYDYLGEENVKDGVLADKIDLFGWSGEGSNAPFGVSTSTNNADYAGEFVDWGSNVIGGDAANTWRTLTIEEWEYLIVTRKNAAALHGVAAVNGVNGIVVLPDDWELPEGVVFKAGFHQNDGEQYYSDYQNYTESEWQKMENNGAVFLPAAGIIYGGMIVKSPGGGGHYQAASMGNIDINSRWFGFRSSYYTISSSACKTHRSVRLVHDTIVPKVEPEYVDLGLSVKWATFNVGATSPEDYGDYFAWGETEPKETYSWATYKWCDGTQNTMTKYNTTDGKTILDSEDDAAYVHWGGKWRMPSKEEVDELTQQCNWIWTTHNNVNGYKVTGPNGNSIFLPAAGYKGSGPTYPAGEDGLYWTNTLEKQHYSYLIVLHYDAPPTQVGRQGTRCFGFTIRPVYDEVPDPCLVVKVNDTLSINLMCVEGGTFMMGSDAPDAQADEQPVHEVTLSDYYIGQTEVTQHLWKAVMGSDNNPSAVKGNNLPVTNITWDEAQVFVERLSELTGMRFRLPTEAEWEYAARGGQKSKGYTYAGSNDIDQVGWYNGNSSNKTHAVGQKQPNELGIYDMTGNVWEYCSDWHMPYAAQAQTNPTGAATGDKHVLRGGCYHYDPKNCTNTNRHSYYTPDKGGASTGLRIVLEP